MHRLLIVHPDHKLQGLYKKEVSKFFNVDSAFDGLQGLRLIKQSKPDLILSSFHLPIISGKSLLKMVRSHPQMHSTPFIFIDSIHPEPESLELGANEWLMISQTSPEQLVARCHQHLKLKPLIYV